MTRSIVLVVLGLTTIWAILVGRGLAIADGPVELTNGAQTPGISIRGSEQVRGKLTKVPAEKTLLPHDPKGHHQAIDSAIGPGGAVYVNQATLMCKSTDGEAPVEPGTSANGGSAGASPSRGDGFQRRERRVDRAVAKRARSAAAHRRRRVIFNDDSEELAREEANTVDGFVSVRLTPMVGTQVDTICWSALAIWGDAPVYDSKVQPLFGKPAHGGEAPGGDLYVHYAANAKKMIEAGTCPLRTVIQFAHKHEMEAFASIRMNDVHDSFVPGIQTIWKRNHPEYLVQTGGKPPIHKVYVTAQDYAHQAVRDRKFEVIEEICDRYDVDGIELDYIRHPVLFSSVIQGGSATDAEVAIMTSFMDRIRSRMDQLGTRRKRPLLLAARVPDTFDQAKKIGLDVQAWLKQDLVDILIIGGGYSPFSLKLNDIVKVAHRHDVLVYPCINSGPLKDFTSVDDLHIAARAVAMNWRSAGADGVYLWNLGTTFNHDRGQAYLKNRATYFACLRDIGDLQTLVNRDKLYAIDGPVFAPYVLVSTKSPLPVTLSPNTSARLPLVVADDLKQATRAGSLRRLELHLALTGSIQIDSLVVRLNGVKLVTAKLVRNDAGQAHSSFNFAVTAPPLKQGMNTLQIGLKDGTKSAQPITLRRVHLALDYK